MIVVACSMAWRSMSEREEWNLISFPLNQKRFTEMLCVAGVRRMEDGEALKAQASSGSFIGPEIQGVAFTFGARRNLGGR